MLVARNAATECNAIVFCGDVTTDEAIELTLSPALFTPWSNRFIRERYGTAKWTTRNCSLNTTEKQRRPLLRVAFFVSDLSSSSSSTE